MHDSPLTVCGIILLRMYHLALRPCGLNPFVVVYVIVVDIVARIRHEGVVIVVIIRRAEPEPFNQIPICYEAFASTCLYFAVYLLLSLFTQAPSRF